MTVTVKHKFVSSIADGTDTSLVRPSNWNDTHDLAGLGTMAEQNANAVAITGGTISNVTFTSDTVSNNLAFTPTSAPSYLEGDLWYDSTAKALAYYNDSSTVTVHLGQDLIIKVINNTGSTIANGSPVYVTGTSSGQTYPNIALAKADVAATSSVLGLTNGAIPNGSIGYVTAQGGIDGVNTGSFTVGQILYLSPYSAGQLMNTVPPTGITVQVGIVTYVNSSTGKIYVKQTIPLSLVSTFSAGTTGFTPSTATSGAITLGGTLVIANGGTNGTVSPTAGTVAYGDGTKYNFTSTGISGQVLLSQGSSAPIWSDASGIRGLGTMALQNANAVSITGGTIDGTDIGQTTPAKIKGTSVEATGSFTGDGSGLTGTAPNLTSGNATAAQQLRTLASNGTGVSIPAGKAVYLFKNGTSLQIKLADATTYDTSQVVGVTATVIPTSGTGYVTMHGYISGLDTSAYQYGQILYLSGTTPGDLSATEPVSPLYAVHICYVMTVSATTGTIFVNPINHSVNDDYFIGLLKIAHGGTNSTAIPTAGAVAYGDGTKYVFNSAGTSGQVLTSNGSGAPTWTTLSGIGVTSFSAGTTGFTPSTATTGAITLAGTLGTANGGTNNTATPTAGTVAYGDGSKITYTAAGTTGQALLSNGSSAPTWGTPAGSLTISDDVATNSTFYPTFTSATSGTITAEKVSSTRFSYNPSTGSITTYGDAFFNGMRVGHGAANVTSNSVVGQDSLGVASGGANNTAMGYQSLKSVTSGSNLTAFGYQAGYSATTADEFNVFGYQAGYSNTDGHGLTAFGYQAGYSNVSGWYNSYLGSHSGRVLVGQYNTAVGGRSLYYQTTGDYNTFVGADIGLNKTGGSNNAAMGYGALYNNGSGSGSIAIGYYAGYYETGSNAFYVNNQDRTNTAGDKASSLLYGTFNATASSQTLKINGVVTASYALTALGGIAGGTF